MVMTVLFLAMSEWVDIKTRDGAFAYQLQKIDGLYMLAQIKKLGERLQQIREIQYKDGDVMIATYPKVGKN